MTVNKHLASPVPDSGPKLHIKATARRLFAERGLRSVTVREIARAAEQRNQGVVAYYFGTKDKLISEILIDGAARIEARRQDFLDALETAGGPASIQQAVEAIILPSARFADEDQDYGSFFNRYLHQLALADSSLIDETLEGRWNQAYQRCLSHMRRLLPHLTPQQQNRRFLLMGSYTGTILAQREAMMTDLTRIHATWSSDAMLDDIVNTTAALLNAPV